jgi:hypothetical protein
MTHIQLASSNKPFVALPTSGTPKAKKEALSTPSSVPHWVILKPPLPRDIALLQKALSCVDVQTLYMEASKSGPWKIVFNPEGKSFTDFATSTIHLNISYTDDKALCSFIFQLIQITQKKEIQTLHDHLFQNKIDQKTFAKEREKLTHAACLRHHAVVQKAVTVLKWHPSIDKYRLTDPNFDTHWQAICQKDLEKKRERLLLKLVNSEEALKLYLSVNKEHPFTLVFDPLLTVTKGRTSFDTRTILIRADLSEEETLAIYLIELLNASKEDDFKTLVNKARQNTIDKEAFAKGMEKIEHENCLKHSSIVTKSKWDPKVNKYKKIHPDFEKVWNEIKTSRHTDNYREMWEKLRMLAEDTGAS